MIEIKGIAASSGYAMGKAFILQEQYLDIHDSKVTDMTEEIKRLELALDKAKSELEEIKEQARVKLGEDKAEIFAAHLLVLNDPELIGPIKEKIRDEKVNAQFAFYEISQMFVTMFEQLNNEYMRERAADIKDVTKRVISHLLGVQNMIPSTISEKIIIVAKDLTPSDTAQLNKEMVLGFTTDIGGRTSHSAIMARSLEIPAVVGTREVTEKVSQDDFIIIDGVEGIILINPSAEKIEEYKKKQEQFIKQKQEWTKLVNKPTFTKDNIQVELVANIGTPEDVKGVLENGGEGIGLYRTEFLYMGKNQLPTEEEQFQAYKTVLSKMNGKPVVVRTIDIGGDKELPYLDLPKELNPFLGHRAIRLTLERQDIFKTQLRALLRASVYGRLKIMFPMIATVTEFLQAKELLLEEKKILQKEGLKVSEDIEIGMMVEIPSAAVLADQFAKHVDFFSVGTNDLIQYTMAADRMNEKVSYLYQPYNPAILRLINMIINAAHNQGKWVGMCGEMAGDPIAIPILIGLGLDEFSMSATSILSARTQIANLVSTDAKEATQHVLNLATNEEVVSYIKDKFNI